MKAVLFLSNFCCNSKGILAFSNPSKADQEPFYFPISMIFNPFFCIKLIASNS
jgi:hypothetical protein